MAMGLKIRANEKQKKLCRMWGTLLPHHQKSQPNKVNSLTQLMEHGDAIRVPAQAGPKTN
jgi:hypothetical protein